jgi:hypothetical protein
MTSIRIYPLAIILYYIYITNIGFEDRIWNNLESNNNIYKNIFLINAITLASIVFFYLVNFLGGKFLYNSILKGFESKSEKKDFNNMVEYLLPGEYKDILFGLTSYALLQTIITGIISGIIYYSSLKKWENYLMSITIGSVEYIKINILEIITFLFRD